ncbi:MAG: hypothetical protein KA923_03555, partial [Opitutaceae bacterium]|nr:hypothetical protein [Opitutaceae bacterium]
MKRLLPMHKLRHVLAIAALVAAHALWAQAGEAERPTSPVIQPSLTITGESWHNTHGGLAT